MKHPPLHVLAFTLAACASRAAVAQPAPERMPLRGHISSLSGQPRAGVVVIVRKKPTAQTGAFWGGAVLSDARGDFVLEEAEEGEYEIGGEALGLFGATDPTLSYTLQAGSAPAQFRVGAPIALSLQVLGPGGKRVQGQQLLLASRRTSADGVAHWRYDSLPAPEQSLGLTLEPGSTLFVSCFPVGWGVLDLRDVPEGSAAERSIMLRPGGSLRLSAVEEGTSQPIAGVLPVLGTPSPSDLAAAKEESAADDLAAGGAGEIANLSHWEAQQRAVATGADGVLAVPNLRPGFYMVSVRREGFYEPASQLVRIVEGQKTARTITLRRRSTDAPK